MQSQQFSVKNLDELAIVAKNLLTSAKSLPTSGAAIIALTGDLGAGKTALTKCLARELGVSESVTSPTFVIMKQYEIDFSPWTQLIHIDAYRIEELSEVEPLKLVEIFADQKNIICLEWPEHILPVLPGILIEVKINIEKDESRTVSIKTTHVL